MSNRIFQSYQQKLSPPAWASEKPPASPDELLWWAVLLLAVRDAIKDRLKRGDQPKVRQGEALKWLKNRKEVGVGSFIWVVRSLEIRYYPEIIALVEESSYEELEETLRML